MKWQTYKKCKKKKKKKEKVKQTIGHQRVITFVVCMEL